MIEKLAHSVPEIAKDIYFVWQASYIVEAKILQADNFPPLNRTVEDFINSTTDFYCYSLEGHTAGIIEIDRTKNAFHIQSLVVHPDYFRKGVASKLIEYVLNKYKSRNFTVETGLDNVPAIQLYHKHGFVEEDQYDTDHGIRKIRFAFVAE